MALAENSEVNLIPQTTAFRIRGSSVGEDEVKVSEDTQSHT